MPRKLQAGPSKFYGNMYITFAIITIFYLYLALIAIKIYYAESTNYIIMIAAHWIMLMVLWWFMQTVFTDPGQVPVFWGFRKGDPVSRRKRYCLICNVFKPERCHHCSNCNRWVLNMDHHWPWINNCIGFWNRKSFILLLFYVVIGIYLYLIYMSIDVYYTAINIYNSFIGESSDLEYAKIAILSTSMILGTLICILITSFFKFHIQLLIENKTTIEWIANKHEYFHSIYDISLKHNIQQVFGKNILYAFLPITTKSSLPTENGVRWKTNLGLERLSEESRKYENPLPKVPGSDQFQTPLKKRNDDTLTMHTHDVVSTLRRSILSNKRET